MLPFAGPGSEAAAFKRQLFRGRIRHHHHQHFLVNVDSCYLVGHGFLSGEEAAERAAIWDYAPLRADALPRRKGSVTLFGSKRAFRIKLPTASTNPERSRPLPFPVQSTLSQSHRFSSPLVSRRLIRTPEGRGSKNVEFAIVR